MNDDLIRAFANTIEAYSELHSKCWGATPDECKKLMTMEFPLVQGMVMQNAIRKVGNMPYDSQKAAEQIVTYSKSGGIQQQVQADSSTNRLT